MSGLDKRYAIIIGSNNYKERKLQFPIKDANDISSILIERCGFEEENIIPIIFNNLEEVHLKEKVLSSFSSIVQKGFIKNMHTFFFYFSGHGKYEEEEGKSYIELSDTESISIQEILKNIESLSGKHNYLVVDACESGGTLNLNSPTKSKLDRQFSYYSQGTYCILGATEEKFAFEPTLVQTIDKNINNGILTHFFLDILKDKKKYNEGTLSIKTIDDYLNFQTQKITGFNQVPVSYSVNQGYHPLGIWRNWEEDKDAQRKSPSPILDINYKDRDEEEKGSVNFHYKSNLGNQQNFKELIEGRYRQFARLLAQGGGGISKSSYTVSQDGKVYGWGENVVEQSESSISYSSKPLIISDYGSLAGKTISKVACGRNHTLALDMDGKVYAWGGSYGKLPVAVDCLSGIKDIGVGDSHFLALKINGTIYVRGNGSYGQLGNGHFDLGHYHIPSISMPVGALSEITAISAGANHCLAVKSDGTVYAWGDDSYGQLGNDYNHPNGHYYANLNASAKPQIINNLSEIISVAAGANHSLALKANGTVFTWGADNYANSKVPVQVNNLTGIVAIAAGVSHSLALKVDGNVFIWGGEDEGQDGSVTYNGRLEPKQVEELSDVIAIAGGFAHSLACKLDGTVYAWGFNQFGQLGNGTTTDSKEPVLVPISLKAEIDTISLPSNVFYVGQKDIIVGFTTESITMENYDQKNIYEAQLSNSAGSFSSPVTIGRGFDHFHIGYYFQISCTIPANTPLGTGYRIRVINSKTNVLGLDNGINLTIYAFRASIKWQVLEDFERPNPWPWLPWKSPFYSGQLSTSTAVSGNYGMTGVDWVYRDDVALGKPGDKISMWAKDWACLGFFAGQQGTQYFALGGNEISFHGIPGYVWHPYRMLVPAEFISLPDKWYRLEVTFADEGLEGRVYDSEGVKELACLRSEYTNIGSGGGGISMRGAFIDEITYYLASK